MISLTPRFRITVVSGVSERAAAQFAGTFIFQPFVAFAFLCDEAAGVGGLMGFHRGRHTGGPGIAHKDEAVACGAFRLRDIDVRLLVVMYRR